MLNGKYKFMINARYSELTRDGIPLAHGRAIDAILALPHPQRETSFVELAQVSCDQSFSVDTAMRSFAQVNEEDTIW